MFNFHRLTNTVFKYHHHIQINYAAFSSPYKCAVPFTSLFTCDVGFSPRVYPSPFSLPSVLPSFLPLFLPSLLPSFHLSSLAPLLPPLTPTLTIPGRAATLAICFTAGRNPPPLFSPDCLRSSSKVRSCNRSLA